MQLSLQTPGPARDSVHSCPSAWRGKSVFNAKLFFFSSLSFLSLRPALSSLRKQGLRVYTCDPNFPFSVRFFFLLKKNNSREVSEPLLFLRPMVTSSDRKALYFQIMAYPRLHLHFFPSPSQGHLFFCTWREGTSIGKPLLGS